MKKKNNKDMWKNLALITAAAFAWTKLGVGAAVKELKPIWPIPPPVTEAGYMTQAEWEAAGYGFGMADYEDWLRGQ